MIQTIDKLNFYKDNKIKITFRLLNHPNYFISGKVIEIINPHYNEFDEIKLIDEGRVILGLDNEDKFICCISEIDIETITPSSYDPIRYFLREKISEELKKEVFERDNFECQLKLDGCSGKAECCDHIIPVSCGGRTILENLHASCNNCNLKKSNKILF